MSGEEEKKLKLSNTREFLSRVINPNLDKYTKKARQNEVTKFYNTIVELFSNSKIDIDSKFIARFEKVGYEKMMGTKKYEDLVSKLDETVISSFPFPGFVDEGAGGILDDVGEQMEKEGVMQAMLTAFFRDYKRNNNI